MIDIDDDINLDDIWVKLMIFWWYLGDLYVCSYMRVIVVDDFWWYLDEIDDIINEIDDNYTSLIVWW